METVYKCRDCVYMNSRDGMDDYCIMDPSRNQSDVACVNIRLAEPETDEDEDY